MLKEHRVSKYLLYAVGEILLVVIGILIALQVNNWQTQQKNAELERSLLRGVKEDLEEDRFQIEQRFRRSFNDFNRNIALFDSLRLVEDEYLEITYVDSIFHRCIRQRNTFFPVSGTYKTVINNGLSDVIRDKEVFKELQQIYEYRYVSIINAGDRTDDLSMRLRYDLRNLTALPEGERLAYYKSPVSRNDVEIYRLQLSNFAMNLNAIDKDLTSIITRLEESLK